jgi:sulfide:quinone oxidoreductase
MAEFRSVTPDFAVASSQLAPEDLRQAVAQGFKMVICNRPEAETPGLPGQGEMRQAAAAAGLQFAYLPFAGPAPPNVVAATVELLERAPGPILAYCRTGTRSITAWALAQALLGARRPDEIINLAKRAGYDLGQARGALETLAPKA